MRALTQKKEIVKELQKKLLNSGIVVLTEYRGLKVRDMTELRKKCRECEIEYKVVKNTLISLAIKDTYFRPLQPYIVGPTGIGISNDPVTLAKVFEEFSKEHEEFKIRALMIGEEIFHQEKIKELASLPSKDILMGQVIFYMKTPIYGLVNALSSPLRGLVNVLNGIKSKKEG
jgi:large subunit ribosomal protein L10